MMKPELKIIGEGEREYSMDWGNLEGKNQQNQVTH